MPGRAEVDRREARLRPACGSLFGWILWSFCQDIEARMYRTGCLVCWRALARMTS